MEKEKFENTKIEEKEREKDNTNIFDEFLTDDKLKTEVKENEKKRSLKYYIYIIGNFFGTINFIVFLGILVFVMYIYIQQKEDIKNVSYLNPVCDFIVNNKGDNENCSSVSSLIKAYEINNDTLKNKYYDKNKVLLVDIYRSLNFANSKEVNFLIEKTRSKLKVLEILEEFDKIKNLYLPIYRTRLTCDNFNITSDFEIDINCIAYSGDWDKNIIGFNGKNKGNTTVRGTSISIASSFINFIENLDDSKISIIDKPKIFNYTEIANDNGYTKKTEFKLKLKYNNTLLLKK